MKKLLAVMVVVMLTMASGAAQMTPGYVPEFTNASGAVTNSALFQLNNNVGIGTTAPLAMLHVVSGTAVAGMIDAYSGSPTTSLGALPMVSRAARGTAASPSGVKANDYIGGLGARAYGATKFTNGWRAAVLLRADQDWTDTAQGTNIAFGVTAPNTAAQMTAMTLTSGGALGIGTNTPDSLLTVVGPIHSTSGGFKFPDGSTQASAAANVTSGSGLIATVTNGTATLGIDTSVLQSRVSGSCPNGAISQINQSGTVQCVSVSGTAASVPVIVAQTSFAGSYGAGASNTIFTADEDAFYRVSVYMNATTPLATCSSSPCAGEAITVQWNDGLSTTALVTANCNLQTPCGSSAVTPMWVKNGQAITAYGQSYGAGTAPSNGGYNAYVLVEKLKK